MQNVFGRNGLLPNPALCEGNVFSNSRIEVMGDHHHIEGLIKRIDSVWSRWSRRRWNDVWLAADFDDVWGMSTSRPFGVKCMDSPAFEGGDGAFHETTLVQRIGMDKNLHIHVI